MSISPDKLARIDLNLLVSMQVLIEERNVTRAAERLFITQPAMSRTLTRLRELFEDPLFTRAARGLVPSPRTEALQTQLPELLLHIANIVSSDSFDPATYKYTFHIAVLEQYGHSLFGQLMNEIREEAPYVQVETSEFRNDVGQNLASGTIDFAVNIEQPEETDIDFLPLISGGPTIIAKHGHPLANKRALTLKDILSYAYVRCFPSESQHMHSEFDDMLSKTGNKAQVFFSTSNLLSALQVLDSTDGLLAGPASILTSKLLGDKFVNLGLPKELRGFETVIGLTQHRRTLNSQPHQWLAAKIATITERAWADNRNLKP